MRKTWGWPVPPNMSDVAAIPLPAELSFCVPAHRAIDEILCLGDCLTNDLFETHGTLVLLSTLVPYLEQRRRVCDGLLLVLMGAAFA